MFKELAPFQFFNHNFLKCFQAKTNLQIFMKIIYNQLYLFSSISVKFYQNLSFCKEVVWDENQHRIMNPDIIIMNCLSFTLNLKVRKENKFNFSFKQNYSHIFVIFCLFLNYKTPMVGAIHQTGDFPNSLSFSY